MKSKVVFLDIDGVLVTHRAHLALKNTHMDESFDPISTGLLKRFISETDSKLVLSSTWRFRKNPIEYICSRTPILTPEDFHKYPFTGSSTDRCEEITDWLMDNFYYVENFCVIDDSDKDNRMKSKFGDRFIRTNSYEGLGFAEYRALCSLFES